MARATIEGSEGTLTLSGVVDFDSVPALMSAAEALPRSNFHAVDVSGLEKIDSAGVAFLLWLKKHHGTLDRPLEIQRASTQLERLLSVTGIGKMLKAGDGQPNAYGEPQT